MALVYYAPDGIQATKGELIEFPCRIFPFFFYFPILTYFHFAVYTVDSEADAGLTNDQPPPVGDGFTVGVARLPFFYGNFPRLRLRINSQYIIVAKTIRDLCDNELGCGVNNLDKAATEKGLEPFDPDTIVARARFYLRQNLIENYYLLTKNCEHFATKCRYGEEFSQQASARSIFRSIISILYSLLLNCLLYFIPFSPMDRIIQEVRWNEENN